ncbi:TPA: RNA 2',3'-cyclic phosphodiesterase [candidate division WWE3 bacterium]|uniref:RNA 2',3'-cyclic phosphodiesterase n=1 Tax=candidate division WWE3 bacterium TaxID=2053526 RepID=A0A354G3H6_UNCKA|nr:RNA 2',3'-cyclic phosphodiesterase [candidate division WWE3 bacterium]
MPRRIFIGIKPDDHITKNIHSMQEQLAFLPVHWVPLENLHVTLLPPWKPSNYEKDLETFKTLKIARPAAPLTFTSVTFFKSKNILWAVGQKSEILTPMIENLRNAFNLVKDERKYLMHMTLAKHVAPELHIPEVVVQWKFTPSTLTLFESLQTNEGTEYKTLSTVSLA